MKEEKKEKILVKNEENQEVDENTVEEISE